jgi:subtilisin-like proprotein convertase family protein
MPILQAAPGASIVAESCGTGSGAIDPGETVTVSLPVRNVGTAATTNLTGTLLSGGGVTSPSGPQSYGVVPVGGTAAQPFTFTANGSCGGKITLSLKLQDGASNLGTVTYSFTLGSLNPLTQTSSASSGNVNAAIPDLGVVEVPINVPDVGAVTDVNVRVRLNHTFDGDLILTLVSPDGTQVTLSNRRGSSGDNFGSGANDCSGTPTVFDDEATLAISAGTAPFAGSFTPDQPLSGFDGKATAGTWKLRVSDNAAADVGTVFCAQLEIGRQVFACCGTAGTPAVVGTGRTLGGESCSPANGAVDPDETVTVSFALANAGSGPTTDLVATLLPTGGVLSPSPAQSYGVIPPDGSSVNRTFSFVPTGTCGGDVTATLHLQDGPLDLGTVSFKLRLGTLVGASYGPFANPASISIPSVGTATPYPSSINVSGITGTVTKVTASILGLSHTFPGDIDILLAGPAGQRIILMSDVGSGTDVINANLTFDDSAPAIGATVVAGTFRPTNSGTGDTFASPAPAAPYGAALADFNGTNPNGAWRLFVVDDASGDVGTISGGWRLSFQTADPVCCSQACSLSCPSVTQGNDPDRCDAQVTFASPGVTGSCGVVACAPPSGSIFPVGTTTDTCTATTQAGATTTCNFPVIVNDVQAPILTAPTASPALLWPPNHTMTNVTINYQTADNCTLPSSITCALSVASNEPLNGTGDGDTTPDWQVIDAHHVKLRAERAGTGTGRTYTVTVTCNDAAGVSTSRTVAVNVPLSQ